MKLVCIDASGIPAKYALTKGKAYTGYRQIQCLHCLTICVVLKERLIKNPSKVKQIECVTCGKAQPTQTDYIAYKMSRFFVTNALLEPAEKRETVSV